MDNDRTLPDDDSIPPPAGITPDPSEIAALIELGLSDGAIATYRQVDIAMVASRRRQLRQAPAAPPADDADILARAQERLSVNEMRYQALQLTEDAQHCADAMQRTVLSERAYDLAQEAERRARGLDAGRSGQLATPRPSNDDAVEQARRRAERWRLRAEEYRTVAEVTRNLRARETYLHLARSYDALADRFTQYADHRATWR